jgi:hypothetical protein
MDKWRDIPVLILGFNRPLLLQGIIAQSSLRDFNKVIISIDGPRDGNSIDKQANKEIRELLDQSDFESRFSMTNQGSYAVTSAITAVLAEFPAVIVVEDDLRVAPNALRSISEQLSSLDSKIATVSGYSPNVLINSFAFSNSWRQSNYFCPWVWGTTRKVWSKYKQEIDSQDLAQLVQSPSWNQLNAANQSKWFLRFLWCVNNPNVTWDFQMQFLHFRESMVSIRPWKSLVTNHGFNSQGQRTQNEPIWNPRISREGEVKNSTFRLNGVSNLIDSLTFAADHQLIDSKLHKMVRKLYR